MSLDAGFWRRWDLDEGDNGRLPKEAENNLLFPLGLSFLGDEKEEERLRKRYPPSSPSLT